MSDTYQATARMSAAAPDANVRETTTPRKRTVDLDAMPPPREDGPLPVPRRFSGRVYEAVTSGAMRGEGMTTQRSAETYGLCTIHVTRDIVGVNGEHWKKGDEVSGVPINAACLLVNDKVAMFDKSEFQGEGEIEALEKLGYRVEPPMQKARDKSEFQPVIARKKSRWVSESLDPALKTP